MADAFHAVPLKHNLRRAILQIVARLPIPPQRTKTDRILLIRPDHLGDVLLTTPAIRALCVTYPNTEIHALVGAWSAQVFAPYPEIDRVLTLPFPGFNRASKKNLHSPYQLALISAFNLRKIGYRTAIILRPDHWWGAMLAYLAGIPTRIGYDLPDVAPFLTERVAHHNEHVVLQNVALMESLIPTLDRESLKLSFPVSDASRTWIYEYLHERSIKEDTPVVAIHPGSGTWVKQWDEEKWAIMADTLADQLDAKIVFTGGDHEAAMAQNIAARMHHSVCVAAGDTDLGSLAALFERARIVLGADSGPMHLAVAVGTPTVTLFGAADPLEFGSWGDPNKHRMLYSDIGCRPCRILDWGADDPAFHPCVREISVARALDAVHRALSHTG
jgi:heptosyltransferase-2/heptosyltransferase-3